MKKNQTAANDTRVYRKRHMRDETCLQNNNNRRRPAVVAPEHLQLPAHECPGAGEGGDLTTEENKIKLEYGSSAEDTS